MKKQWIRFDPKRKCEKKLGKTARHIYIYTYKYIHIWIRMNKHIYTYLLRLASNI